MKIAYQLFMLCLVYFTPVHGTNIKTDKEQKSLPALVSGSVFCNQCLEKTWTLSTIVFGNVIVTIDCADFQATNITSEFGIFTFEVPAEISSKLPSCSVKVTDFSKVDGKLSTCTNPTTLELATGEAEPAPSVPKAVLDGWPWYTAGPFIFQPAEALSTCKGATTPPFVHTTPPTVYYPPPEQTEPKSPPCPTTYPPPFVPH